MAQGRRTFDERPSRRMHGREWVPLHGNAYGAPEACNPLVGASTRRPASADGSPSSHPAPREDGKANVRTCKEGPTKPDHPSPPKAVARVSTCPAHPRGQWGKGWLTSTSPPAAREGRGPRAAPDSVVVALALPSPFNRPSTVNSLKRLSRDPCGQGRWLNI